MLPSSDKQDLWVPFSPKQSEANEFIASVFDLLNDEITGPDWLANLGRLASCDSVSCCWWPVEQPMHYLEETAGRNIELPDDWAYRLEAWLASSDVDELQILGEPSAVAAGFIDNTECPVLAPGRLLVVLDRHPARVVMLFERAAEGAAWEPDEHARLATVLGIVRKSLATKRKLSILEDSLELANKVFDCIPRSIITIMPNLTIVGANRRAEQLMAAGTICRRDDDVLRFTSKTMQHALEEQLDIVQQLELEELEGYGWYKKISGAPGKPDSMLTMRALGFDQWRRESAPYGRAVVVTLVDKAAILLPGEARLREFFELTKAQARLVNELMRQGSLNAAAKSLNISIHTARSHLRAIYEKTGVDNQAQFYRLISQSFTAYAPDEEN